MGVYEKGASSGRLQPKGEGAARRIGGATLAILAGAILAGWAPEQQLEPAVAGRGLLMGDVPAAGFDVPGDPAAVAALGYLHANCGHCHHAATSRPLQLRLSVGARTVEETDAYRTGVGVESEFKVPTAQTRIVPGHPDASTVHYRMSVRRRGHQMPNWGTSVVDEQGLRAVDAWIAGLAPKE